MAKPTLKQNTVIHKPIDWKIVSDFLDGSPVYYRVQPPDKWHSAYNPPYIARAQKKIQSKGKPVARKRKLILAWEAETVPIARTRIKHVGPFDARGKRCVYGRGDHCAGRPALKMDLWVDRAGRFWARFSSQNRRIGTRAVEIIGMPSARVPSQNSGAESTDKWIPRTLREEYEDWVFSECWI